jgi:hypothetical protein
MPKIEKKKGKARHQGYFACKIQQNKQHPDLDARRDLLFPKSRYLCVSQKEFVQNVLKLHKRNSNELPSHQTDILCHKKDIRNFQSSQLPHQWPKNI